MRITIVKAVSAVLLAAPIVGPATVLLAHSNAASSAPSSACPSGMSSHQGGSYTQDKDHLTPIRLSANGDCYSGITVKGNFASSQTWWDLKQCCNGAGITVDSGPAALVNPRTDNIAVDGIRIWHHAATTIDGAWSTDTRDDCVSDTSHGDLVIRNSLFDGCHTGISWRSGSSSTATKPFKIDVQNSMFYIKPMTDHGSGGNCKEWVQNGKDNGTMWKMDKVQSGVNVQNVMIRMDMANYQCVDKWPSGTYNNVVLVWNNSADYPGTLPAGVTVTRDVSVWDNAKAQWMADHTYSGGASGDGTGSGPTPQPSDSPS